MKNPQKRLITGKIATITILLKRFSTENDVTGITLLPETAGRISQLGSLEEIMMICEEIPCVQPCLDVAHYHACTQGSLRCQDDFESLLDTVEHRLGVDRLSACHFHMYPIEWGAKGEIRHRAFSDITEMKQISLFQQDSDCGYLPRYEPFLRVLHRRQLSPIIICEAKQSQDIGAKAMKLYWQILERQER